MGWDLSMDYLIWCWKEIQEARAGIEEAGVGA